MSIGGDELLTLIESDNNRLGQFIRRYMIPAIETTARNAGVSPTGRFPAPQPPQSVTATPATTGDMIQVVVDHTAPLQIGAHYIYSIANNPQFANAMIEAKPATRSPMHFAIPTFKSDGVTKHDYYVAVQVQYPGSLPSAPVYHGGGSATAINLNGTAAADIQDGTGSGTAKNGTDVLVGLGKQFTRPGPQPKRSVNAQ